MRKSLTTAALAATLLIAVMAGTLLNLHPSPAVTSPSKPTATRQQSSAQPTTTTEKPSRIAPDMLLSIQSMPEDLSKAIKASAQSRYEIVAVTHSRKTPLEPMAPAISAVWCITLYPAATFTLYTQRYVAPKDKAFITNGDYVPGKSQTGAIDHFLALQRANGWELYHPEVYPWKALGC